MPEFDNMTLEEIHAVSRYGNNQYEILSSICSYIQNTDVLIASSMLPVSFCL